MIKMEFSVGHKVYLNPMSHFLHSPPWILLEKRLAAVIWLC